jgi:hypothetical protein
VPTSVSDRQPQESVAVLSTQATVNILPASARGVAARAALQPPADVPSTGCYPASNPGRCAVRCSLAISVPLKAWLRPVHALLVRISLCGCPRRFRAAGARSSHWGQVQPCLWPPAAPGAGAGQASLRSGWGMAVMRVRRTTCPRSVASSTCSNVSLRAAKNSLRPPSVQRVCIPREVALQQRGCGHGCLWHGHLRARLLAVPSCGALSCGWFKGFGYWVQSIDQDSVSVVG